MVRLRGIYLLLFACLVAAGCTRTPRPADQPELIISAAASLRDALEELAKHYQSEHGALTLRYNFGSSGALRQQIEQGAPVDLFISAAVPPMEALIASNLVEAEEVVTLLTNKVVLIRPENIAVVTDWDTVALPEVTRFALGNPSHVPAGQYGKTVLESLGRWQQLQGRLVLGEDVRQVLAYVESGEVQAGIVYSTDAATASRITVVAEAPPGSHAPIIYPMAVVRGSKNPDAAANFAQFLMTEQAGQVFQRYGFEVNR